ncbi:MAG: sulfur carrier protein ThiS adenylyltransferase ThiF, partial [Bacteroidetes bacterium]|nr:sulfur carrier protein ThiS adenylyltransferase ThiF [Bacteroidota bacterium]
MTFEEIKTILSGKRVGIAGCGGLGSNCAVALARIGVGTLVIADFDEISESNLNRQHYFYDQIGQKKAPALKANIARINPLINVVASDVKITRENFAALFAGCDVVIEAFDMAAEKEMLIETMLDEFPSIPLVIGIGMAGWGKNEIIHYRRVDNIHICGDEISEIGSDLPPLAPRVGIVANM